MQIEIEAGINNDNASYNIKSSKQPHRVTVSFTVRAIAANHVTRERSKAKAKCNEKNEIE